ncbi:MAG: class I SAM-dependent methyltransferase [Candidatus Eremiobacterota bacterium]
MVEDFFFRRKGCPFCSKSGAVVRTIRYQETAEANPDLPDFEGHLHSCQGCGVAYSSHGCRVDKYAAFYGLALRGFEAVDTSMLQKARIGVLKLLARHRGLLQWVNHHSLNIFHFPITSRIVQGVRMLDIGCGFGEFVKVFHSIGAVIEGTEIIPELVERLSVQGYPVHLGELEGLSLPRGAYDCLLLRGVLYRTADPDSTLITCRQLLRPGGELALVDPCPYEEGLDFFLRKHFPQGHYYVVDPGRFMALLRERYGFSVKQSYHIYGRPSGTLREMTPWSAIMIALELLEGNLRRRRPYLMNCSLLRL